MQGLVEPTSFRSNTGEWCVERNAQSLSAKKYNVMKSSKKYHYLMVGLWHRVCKLYRQT